MSSGGGQSEAVTVRDAATQQVAALQEQLRRQRTVSNADMQCELDAMQQESRTKLDAMFQQHVIPLLPSCISNISLRLNQLD